MPERDQVGPPELGGQWPQTTLQEGLQAPAPWRPVSVGAAALGVLRPQEEADGEKEIFLYVTKWDSLCLHQSGHFEFIIIIIIIMAIIMVIIYLFFNFLFLVSFYLKAFNPCLVLS